LRPPSCARTPSGDVTVEPVKAPASLTGLPLPRR
jgi:hypothetical protein